MTKKINIVSIFLLVIILLVPGILYEGQSKAPSILNFNQKFTPLKKELIEAGFSASFIDTVYSDSRVKYYPDIVFNKRGLPEYHTTKNSIKNDHPFHKYNINEIVHEYSEYFKKAQNLYGVDKEAILAVLYVETKFGKLIGKHYILNVLSSLAMADKEFAMKHVSSHVEKKYHYLSDKKRDYIKNYFKNYASRKALQARNQLISLLNLYKEKKLEIRNLTGSYAGAFGYPQFMPSNYDRYAVDGNKDGEIDLFTFPDAIVSIGKFLEDHGWSASLYAKKRALRRYNNSGRYVANVLNTARFFEKRSPTYNSDLPST